MPIIVAIMFSVGGFLGYVIEDTYNEPNTPIVSQQKPTKSEISIDVPLTLDFRCEDNPIQLLEVGK